MSVFGNQYIRGDLQVNGTLETKFIDTLTANSLVIGNNQATKIEIAKNSVDTEIKGAMNILEYIELNDIVAPSNPLNGQGRLYKKSGDDGIFWKPDSAGVEVDLTQTGSGIFGSEYQTATSSAVSTNNTTTFQQKLRLATSSLTGGTYRIGWYYNWNLNDSKYDFEARVQIDNVTTIHNHRQEPHDKENDQLFATCGFYHGVLSSGNHNIDIDYRVTSSSKVASISNARLEFWKV